MSELMDLDSNFIVTLIKGNEHVVRIHIYNYKFRFILKAQYNLLFNAANLFSPNY